MACPCFRAGAFFGLGVSFVQNTATIFESLWRCHLRFGTTWQSDWDESML